MYTADQKNIKVDDGSLKDKLRALDSSASKNTTDVETNKANIGTNTELVTTTALTTKNAANAYTDKMFLNSAGGAIIGDSLKLADIKYSLVSEDRAKEGLLQFQFGKELITRYPELYARIGNMFEAAHVNAGQEASGANYFYPTPVPGSYGRSAIPDIELAPSNISTNANVVIKDVINGRDGTKVRFKADVGSVLPEPFNETTDYFIGYEASNNFKLYLSEAKAFTKLASDRIAISTQGSGTFKLTQAGISLDHAMDQHVHTIHFNNTTATNGMAQQLNLGSQGGDVYHANSSLPVGGALNTNVSNETRPDTFYEFGYIKADKTIPFSGTPVSQIKYDTGWINRTSWRDIEIPILHGQVEGNLSELDIKVLFSPDGTDANSFMIKSGIKDQVNSLNPDAFYGYDIKQVSTTEKTLKIAQKGLIYLSDSGGFSALNIQSFYYKVVVEKRNYENTGIDVSDYIKKESTAQFEKIIPQVGDKLYHFKGDENIAGRTIHSNLMEDSEYPVDGSKGIWCGEKYNNLTKSSLRDSYTFSIQTPDPNQFVELSTTARGLVHLRFKARFIKKIQPNGMITIWNSINTQEKSPELNVGLEWTDCYIEYDMQEGTILRMFNGLNGHTKNQSLEFKDMFITTIPNAPYVEHQQQASNVKIDTSEWNKEQGSFSFETGDYRIREVTPQYWLDTRVSDPTTGNLMLISENSTGKVTMIVDGVSIVNTNPMKPFTRYTFTWTGTTLTLYANDIVYMEHTTSINIFTSGVLRLGARYNSREFLNSILSNIAYRESIELPTKPFIHPLINIYANGGIQDHLGNWNNEVYYQRKVDKGLDEEVLIMGEDIAVSNGKPYHMPEKYRWELKRIGKVCYMEGLSYGHSANSISFILPKHLRPTTELYVKLPLYGYSNTLFQEIVIYQNGKVLIKFNVEERSTVYLSWSNLSWAIGE